MILGMIVDGAVGLMCIVLGLLIWLKQKITLLHSYHYKNVKKSDIPAYTRLVGISLILIGAGILITGVLNLFYSPLWWAPLVGGILAGFLVMNRAQKTYNGTWFS